MSRNEHTKLHSQNLRELTVFRQTVNIVNKQPQSQHRFFPTWHPGNFVELIQYSVSEDDENMEAGMSSPGQWSEF